MAEGLWIGADKVIPPLIPLIWDFEVVGSTPPGNGPLVLAANHFSHLDPFVAAVAMRRPVRFLGVDELFGRSWFFDGLTYYLGVIPMPRGPVPLRAMRTSLSHIRRGGAIGVFPEGRRVAEWGESPPKQGAAWLAIKTGAPLIPMFIAGTGGAMALDDLKLKRHPIRVEIGEPLHPGNYRDRAEMTDAWWEWMSGAAAKLSYLQPSRMDDV